MIFYNNIFINKIIINVFNSINNIINLKYSIYKEIELMKFFN